MMYARFAQAAAAVILGLVCAASAAQANPVTYRLTGQASISLNSDAGFNAGFGDFTISAAGETDNVQTLPGGVFVNDLSDINIHIGPCAVEVACVPGGDYHVTNPGSIANDTSSHFANIFPLVAFFSADADSPLFTYDLKSSLGPVQVRGNGFVIPFLTDGGSMSFTGAGADNLVFSAVVSDVPEPGAWALLLVGFGGIGAVMRTRRRTVVS